MSGLQNKNEKKNGDAGSLPVQNRVQKVEVNDAAESHSPILTNTAPLQPTSSSNFNSDDDMSDAEYAARRKTRKEIAMYMDSTNIALRQNHKRRVGKLHDKIRALEAAIGGKNEEIERLRNGAPSNASANPPALDDDSRDDYIKRMETEILRLQEVEDTCYAEIGSLKRQLLDARTNGDQAAERPKNFFYSELKKKSDEVTKLRGDLNNKTAEADTAQKKSESRIKVLNDQLHELNERFKKVNWQLHKLQLGSSPDSGYDDSETTQPLSVASTLEQATNSDSNDAFDDFSVLPESSSSSRQKKGSCKRGKANRGQLSTRPTKQNIAGPKELKMNLSKVQDKDAFAGKLQKIAKTYYDQNKLLHQDFSEAREKVNKWWDVMEDLELESDATTKAVIQKLKERYDRRCQSGWTKKKEVEFIEAQEKLAKTEDHSKMLQNEIDAKNDGHIKPVHDTTSQAITELKKALSEEQNKTTALSATIQKLSEENNTLMAAKKSLETENTEFITIINAKNGQIEQDNDITSQTINELKTALSEEKDKTAASSATIQELADKNNTLVAAKTSLENEKTELTAKLEALSKSNSNLDEINAVVIKVNCLLEKKMEENNEKLVKDRQKLEYDRKEMMEIIELKNQECEKEAKELVAAKTELKNEQEEFEAKMKNDEENLAKKREDLKKEAMLLYEKAKVVYAKAMSMEEEELGNEKTKIVSLEEEKNCMQTKIKRLDKPFDQIGFERSNYEENGLCKPLETEWDNQQISN